MKKCTVMQKLAVELNCTGTISSEHFVSHEEMLDETEIILSVLDADKIIISCRLDQMMYLLINKNSMIEYVVPDLTPANALGMYEIVEIKTNEVTTLPVSVRNSYGDFLFADSIFSRNAVFSLVKSTNISVYLLKNDFIRIDFHGINLRTAKFERSLEYADSFELIINASDGIRVCNGIAFQNAIIWSALKNEATFRVIDDKNCFVCGHIVYTKIGGRYFNLARLKGTNIYAESLAEFDFIEDVRA